MPVFIATVKCSVQVKRIIFCVFSEKDYRIYRDLIPQYVLTEKREATYCKHIIIECTQIVVVTMLLQLPLFGLTSSLLNLLFFLLVQSSVSCCGYNVTLITIFWSYQQSFESPFLFIGIEFSFLIHVQCKCLASKDRFQSASSFRSSLQCHTNSQSL